MKGFIDHPVKKVIRNNWCMPLIKHLSEQLGYKLTYLGLPGIDAIDVLTWIDYLQKIIAFEIGHYDKPYNDRIAKDKIAKLYKILSQLEDIGRIEDFSLYHGYIEEVILKGMDLSRTTFTQNNVITLYNLDFCNALKAPIRIPDPFTGNVSVYYKSEVFNKLLAFQHDISLANGGNSKFIFFLTIHSNFWEEEGYNRIAKSKYSFYEKYTSSLKGITEEERNVRLLRFYVFDLLSTQFIDYSFVPEFLPTLDYMGVGHNRLLCFTVIGTFYKDTSGTTPFLQDIDLLIKEKFLRPTEIDINYHIHSSLKEKNCNRDSVEAIKELNSYRYIWNK